MSETDKGDSAIEDSVGAGAPLDELLLDEPPLDELLLEELLLEEPLGPELPPDEPPPQPTSRQDTTDANHKGTLARHTADPPNRLPTNVPARNAQRADAVHVDVRVSEPPDPINVRPRTDASGAPRSKSRGC
jgi:hypothetical protein